MSGENGGNGTDWLYTIKESGYFFCSIKDCDGILHIMPDGKKRIERFEDKIVVIIDQGGSLEKEIPFPLQKNGHQSLGVEVYTSNCPPPRGKGF